jgi:hypothetical protein
VTVAQLRELGLTGSSTAKRVKDGLLFQAHAGVYAVGHAKLSERGRYMAAVLAAGEGAVLASLSAAVLWRAWRRPVRDIHVLSPRRHRPHPDFRLRTTRHLDPRDITVLDAIPVTTVARTLVDLTDVLSAPQLANVIHEAAYHELFDRMATHEAIRRANGRRNLDRLYEALEAEGAGTRTYLEDRFLAFVEGLPKPKINTRVAGFEVDFAWPGLVVEVDGPGHKRPRTRREDRIRDAALKRAGNFVMRLTDQDL